MRLLLCIVRKQMEKGIYFDSEKIEREMAHLLILSEDIFDKNEEWTAIINGCQNLDLGNRKNTVTQNFQRIREILIRKQKILSKIHEIYRVCENNNLTVVEALSLSPDCGKKDSSLDTVSLLKGWTGKICPRILSNPSIVVEDWLYQYITEHMR